MSTTLLNAGQQPAVPGRTHGPGDRTRVRIEQVTKGFSRRGQRTTPRLALDGFDLTIEPGEFLCLLGPSGCGKSTVLQMLAGFSTPNSGRVLVGHEPVTGPGPDRGVLFQSPMLFDWMTVLDNVLYGPRVRGNMSEATRRRALELLDVVGLAGFDDAYPHQLSGGMRHRAAFARVLVNRPRLLLMDEPFGALDAITRASMQELLLDLWQEDQITILFVTHDVDEAVLLGDRICVMSGSPGRTKAVFPVDLPRPRTLDAMDSPDFVQLKGRVRHALC